MKTILCTHEKGGCGVTTTATNLAYLLAQKGKRVLLVDLDSRGDCATALGLDPKPGLTAYLADRLFGRDVAAADVVLFGRDGLDVVPMNASGLRAALTLIDGLDVAQVADWLRALGEGYDVVLFDAKAASGALRRAALRLADLLIIPTRLEALGLAEIEPLIREYGRASVVILPVAVRRQGVHIYNQGLLQEHFGAEMVWVGVPDRVAVVESHSNQSPVAEYDPGNDAAIAYRGVADAVYAELFEGERDHETVR